MARSRRATFRVPGVALGTVVALALTMGAQPDLEVHAARATTPAPKIDVVVRVKHPSAVAVAGTSGFVVTHDKTVPDDYPWIYSGEVQRFDTRTGEATGKVELGPVSVWEQSGALALTSDALWIAGCRRAQVNGERRYTAVLVQVDPATSQVAGEIPVHFPGRTDMGCTHGPIAVSGGVVWLVVDDELMTVDLASGTIARTGVATDWVTTTADAAYTSGPDGRVTRIPATTMTADGSAEVARAPTSSGRVVEELGPPSVSGSDLWVVRIDPVHDESTLLQIDLTTMRVVRQCAVGTSTVWEVAVDPTTVWVANSLGNAMEQLRPGSCRIRSIPVAKYPSSPVAVPDGVWLVSNARNVVQHLRAG